jgi:hypothetical protein
MESFVLSPQSEKSLLTCLEKVLPFVPIGFILELSTDSISESLSELYFNDSNNSNFFKFLILEYKRKYSILENHREIIISENKINIDTTILPPKVNQNQVTLFNAFLTRGIQTERSFIHNNPILSGHRALDSLLKRTALGFCWGSGQSGGNIFYLNHEDEKILATHLSEAAISLNAFRTYEVRDAAFGAHKEAIECARTTLTLAQKDSLLNKPKYLDPDPPSRKWVNDFAERHGLRLMRAQEIERLRAISCRRTVMLSWFMRQRKWLQRPDELIFNADETMLSGVKLAKAVVPALYTSAIVKESVEESHITAMLCFSASGTKVPPFLILPGLVNLPSELRTLAEKGVTITSSSNGWMTRTLFEVWAHHFVRWLKIHRLSLPPGYSNRRVTLTLDGHISRSNWRALQYLFENGIDVNTFPAHITHVLQPFVVGIANALKSIYAKMMQKYTHSPRLSVRFCSYPYPGPFFTISLSGKTKWYILKFMRFNDLSLN